jgi:hypothetical protein
MPGLFPSTGNKRSLAKSSPLHIFCGKEQREIRTTVLAKTEFRAVESAINSCPRPTLIYFGAVASIFLLAPTPAAHSVS